MRALFRRARVGAKLDSEGCVANQNHDRSTTQHPRSKAPLRRPIVAPTPAEAPDAKRRTAARWRGAIVLMAIAAVAFAIFALLMLLRVGHQVLGKPNF